MFRSFQSEAKQSFYLHFYPYKMYFQILTIGYWSNAWVFPEVGIDFLSMYKRVYIRNDDHGQPTSTFQGYKRVMVNCPL